MQKLNRRSRMPNVFCSAEAAGRVGRLICRVFGPKQSERRTTFKIACLARLLTQGQANRRVMPIGRNFVPSIPRKHHLCLGTWTLP